MKDPKAAFETLLRASGQEIKSCPQDEGICKDKKSLVSRYLLNLPEVFAIGLVWPSTNPTPQEIMSLLVLIRNIIDIRNVFTTVQTQAAPYRFRGMICFYGKHYDAYFYSDFRKQWLVFDDATVKCVGDQWEHVLARCQLGHFHPSVLFYERVPGTYKPAKPVFTVPKPKPKPKPKSYSSIDLLSSNSHNDEPAAAIIEPLRPSSPSFSNLSLRDSASDLLSSPNPHSHHMEPSPPLSLTNSANDIPLAYRNSNSTSPPEHYNQTNNHYHYPSSGSSSSPHIPSSFESTNPNPSQSSSQIVDLLDSPNDTMIHSQSSLYPIANGLNRPSNSNPNSFVGVSHQYPNASQFDNNNGISQQPMHYNPTLPDAETQQAASMELPSPVHPPGQPNHHETNLQYNGINQHSIQYSNRAIPQHNGIPPQVAAKYYVTPQKPPPLQYPFPSSITNKRFIIGGIPGGFKLIYAKPE